MPVYSDKVPGQQFPEVGELVRLGYDKSRKIAWLELRNTRLRTTSGDEEGVQRVLIGAVNKPPTGWEPIQLSDATGGQYASMTSIFSDPYEVLAFQRAILKSWTTLQTQFDFSHGTVDHLAKGTMFGKSLTSASFVAKALKTGFEAIGKGVATWFKLTNWSIDDLLAYANRRAPAFRDFGLVDFKQFAPDPKYDAAAGDPMVSNDGRNLRRIDSAIAASFKGPFTYEKELREVNGIIPFSRVIAYGFRGETRPPGTVKGAGGFLPNYTRPEHIGKHGAKLQDALGGHDMDALNDWMEAETGALNLQNFIKDQTFKGFVSTTKSVAVAKQFATTKWLPNGMMHRGQVDGWVYACLVVGAIELPPRFSHPWVKFNEQELTMPGMLDWENVVACRRVLRTGKFEGPVYMRPALERKDPKAAKKIWKLLSGKSQGPM